MDGQECNAGDPTRVVIDLYNKGLKIKELRDETGLSKTTIYKILKDNNASRSRSPRIYDINEDSLNVDCSEKFYILGLLSSDGHVSTNRKSKYIDISLHKRDKSVLEDINKFFRTDKPIYTGKDNCCRITIYSKILYDIATSYGIMPSKSLNLKISKDIPKEFIRDFLRGVFDGDGYISRNRPINISLGITASREFANQLKLMYSSIGHTVKIYDITDRKKNKNKLYSVHKAGIDGIKILNDLYSVRSLFMPRKYEVFLSHARPSIDEAMMKMAFTISQRSTCMRAKVGCIITNNDRSNIISIGYNGQIRNAQNHCDSVYPGQCGCVHAEENALIKNDNKEGTVLFCTTMPCPKCAKLICQSSIREVFFGMPYRNTYARNLFRKHKIKNTVLPLDKFNWKFNL